MKIWGFVAITMMFFVAFLLPAGGSHGADAHEGHGHGTEKSDLDRPVDEMWKEKCEHDILQYTCEECRFELGTVKLVPDLLAGNGKPGIVATGKSGSRKVAESRTFTGEVKLSEGKTVHIASPLPGVIRRVFVDIGATVPEDAPLFEIDSHDVAESKGDYLKKVAARDLAKTSADSLALFSGARSSGAGSPGN